MAVYDQAYRSYTGPTTPPRWRFLILPRYAFQEVFRSKLFTALFALSFAPIFAFTVWIYLHHNLSALALLKIDPKILPAVNAPFFALVMAWQCFSFGFVLTLLAGPGLVSADLANNGLPLYLSRPFSRTEYVLGKMSVLVMLLSVLTWIPGLFLFFLQGYLEGARWLAANLRIAGAIFLGAAMWILPLTLFTLAISAHVKRKPVAQALLLGLGVGGAALGGAISTIFHTKLGFLLNMPIVMKVLWSGLYGVDLAPEIPPAGAWASVLGISAVSLFLLARRLKAYEVVR